MTIAAQIAKHLRDVHFSGNWTTSSLKDALAGVDWQQATTKAHDFNTIASLVYHVNYYVGAAIMVLRGQPLTANDKYSFECPPIQSPEDWQNLLDRVWTEAETLAGLIEQLPDSRLEESFSDPKYGTYYRNLTGTIEHLHYHLGQIVLMKGLVSSNIESD